MIACRVVCSSSELGSSTWQKAQKNNAKFSKYLMFKVKRKNKNTNSDRIHPTICCKTILYNLTSETIGQLLHQ